MMMPHCLHDARPSLAASPTAVSRLLLLGLGLLLGGCTTLQPVPPAATLPDARNLSAWQADGKAGVRFLGNTISATYRWQRDGDNYHAEAAGPLNQGHTTLTSRNGQVVLENAWLGRRESDDAEGLAEAMTSIRIPLSRLNAWLMGWPADPATTVDVLAGEAGVREFREAGWTVRVMAEQDAAGYRIPSRLVMTRAEDRIVLSISSWRPGAATGESAQGKALAATARPDPETLP